VEFMEEYYVYYEIRHKDKPEIEAQAPFLFTIEKEGVRRLN